MIFKCTCDWSWILDFEHGQVIGPFYATYIGTPPQITLSKPRAMPLEEFADLYSDCLDDLYRKISK